MYFSEYRSVRVQVSRESLKIMLLEDMESSNWVEWLGEWPASKPPLNSLLFTLSDLQYWWLVDFAIHPFAAPFANWLEHSRNTLLWGLHELPGLVVDHFTAHQNPRILTLFKDTQVFTRLSLCFNQWKLKRGPPGEYGKYIRQAFVIQLSASSVALRQIESLDKEKASVLSPLISKSPPLQPPATHSKSGKSRNSAPQFSKQFPRRKRFDKAHPFPQKKCFFCGKVGHTQNVCRLKLAKNKQDTAKEKL